MLIIFRWWYFAGIAGLILTVHGCQEFELASRVADEPEAVRLVDLENGIAPSQPYVRLDDHYAVFEMAAYRERKKRGDAKGDIVELLYPIVSDQHPWALQWADLANRYDDLAKVPKRELPQLEPYVFISTKQYDSIDQVPAGGPQSGVVGILGRYGSASSLVDELQPRHQDRVFVLELGRTPTSGMNALLMLLGGVTLIGWAIRRFFRPATPRPQPSATEDSA